MFGGWELVKSSSRSDDKFPLAIPMNLPIDLNLKEPTNGRPKKIGHWSKKTEEGATVIVRVWAIKNKEIKFKVYFAVTVGKGNTFGMKEIPEPPDFNTKYWGCSHTIKKESKFTTGDKEDIKRIISEYYYSLKPVLDILHPVTFKEKKPLRLDNNWVLR